MKKNKYLISAVPLNGHILMKFLTERLRLKGYKIICKEQDESIYSLLEKKKYFSIINFFIKKKIWEIYVYVFILIKRNSIIMFLWPQILGLDLVLRSTKHNKVILYIMDNFFFCIRSYNVHPITNNECLDCLGSVNPHKLCLPFPKKYSKSKNIKYLELFKNSGDKFTFYSQNKLQKILLKKHFGNNINVKLVGMNFGEVKKSQEFIKSKRLGYDIVFHNKSIIAKGLLYIIKIAEFLPEKSFLIPDDKKNVLKIINSKKNLPSNITFQKMDWESGLKEQVTSARLVINPSIWSAPVESALIRSMTFNQNIATVRTIFGYENEIKSIKNHIRLSTNTMIASKQIKEFFKKKFSS